MMASGIDKFVIVITPRDQQAYLSLLGDGSDWGIQINYAIQVEAKGIPQAITLAEPFTSGHPVTLVLGDNLFYGSGIAHKIRIAEGFSGSKIYGYLVNDVSSFGYLEVNEAGQVADLSEKPVGVGRGLAIPGIYHFDMSAPNRVRTLAPSARGEFEIIDLLKSYHRDGAIQFEILDRGTAWLDTGTVEDLYLATELVRVVQERQGMLIGSPEEVAFRRGLIDSRQLEKLAQKKEKSLYGKRLLDLLKDV